MNKAICSRCQSKFVYITDDVRMESVNTLSPNFKTLHKVEKDLYGICPSCDAYALGLDLETGFPFFTSDGVEKTIQEFFA